MASKDRDASDGAIWAFGALQTGIHPRCMTLTASFLQLGVAKRMRVQFTLGLRPKEGRPGASHHINPILLESFGLEGAAVWG